MVVRRNREGTTGEGVFMGTTLFEHGLGKKGVWLHPSHNVPCAMTGSGKSTTSINHLLTMHPGSLIVISPKGEHVDFSLGRRCDPDLFDNDNAPWSGRQLGIDPRGITGAKYHLTQGRCFNLDPGRQTAYPSSRYTFLNDVDIKRPGAIGRLLAIFTGSFPDNPHAKEQWFIKAPRTACAAGGGYVMATDPDPSHHTLPYVIKLLMGIDPVTGVSSPKNQGELFRRMMQCTALDGWIQAVGNSLYQLAERNFGILNSELQNFASVWMLDKSMEEVLGGPSDFSFEDIGIGPPMTVYITPPRGEKAANAWLRSLLELIQLILQQRPHVPRHPIRIICDELAFWGSDVKSIKDALNILRDRNTCVHLYTQSYSQLLSMFGTEGAAEIISASCLQVFGCNDPMTREMIGKRLGRGVSPIGYNGYRAMEELSSPDAIDRDLRLTSPLQYVFPPDGAAMLLGRVAHKPLRTKDGAFFEGLSLTGHYDEHLRAK